MPTHYHLMVYLKTDDLVAGVMHPFSTAYTKAINRQQNRVGPLFQGRFQAAWVDENEYLCHLSRYIHLNPVAAGLVKQSVDWIYSSYPDYIGQRNGALPAPGLVLSQFPSRQAYRQFVESHYKQETGTIVHLLFDE